MNDHNIKVSIAVDQYTKDGNYVASYPSLNQAVRGLLGVDLPSRQAARYSHNISRAVNGYRKTAYKYAWRFNGEPFGGLV